MATLDLLVQIENGRCSWRRKDTRKRARLSGTLQTITIKEHSFHSYHDEDLLEAFKQEKEMTQHFWFAKLGRWLPS